MKITSNANTVFRSQSLRDYLDTLDTSSVNAPDWIVATSCVPTETNRLNKWKTLENNLKETIIVIRIDDMKAEFVFPSDEEDENFSNELEEYERLYLESDKTQDDWKRLFSNFDAMYETKKEFYVGEGKSYTPKTYWSVPDDLYFRTKHLSEKDRNNYKKIYNENYLQYLKSKKTQDDWDRFSNGFDDMLAHNTKSTSKKPKMAPYSEAKHVKDWMTPQQKKKAPEEEEKK